MHSITLAYYLYRRSSTYSMGVRYPQNSVAVARALRHPRLLVFYLPTVALRWRGTPDAKFKPDGTLDTSFINSAQRYRGACCRAAVVGATIDTACQLWRWRLDGQ
eukprot:2488907-Pleurochrysis_carterae.AAC.1